MNSSRHAASRPLIAISLLAAGSVVLASLAVIVAAVTRIARRVVIPAARVSDVEVLDLDTDAQTITLSRTPDTRLPGRYGLVAGANQYLKLGTVLHEGSETVTRKLLTHISADSPVDRHASFSGWYYDRPEQLHLPYRSDAIGTSLGPAPAWRYPAEAGDVWAILVHGRGTTRAETLRTVPVLHEAGVTALLVSYRNDGEAPRSATGASGLGAQEWHDVDAALAFARRHGARRIVLMGWSMGGAIVLQAALNSGHREAISGIILESPVVDWRLVLGYQAQAMRLPRPMTDLVLETLSAPWGARVVHGGAPIPFDELDIVARAAELVHPILLLHSADDGYVPADASYALAAARPDLVTLHRFDGARHTKLWNYDEMRWNQAIQEWLQLVGTPAAM